MTGVIVLSFPRMCLAGKPVALEGWGTPVFLQLNSDPVQEESPAHAVASLTAYNFLWLLNGIHSASSLHIGKQAKGK